MNSDKKPIFELMHQVELDAPIRPAFRFLTNLKMRPWVDHGVGWKVSEVKLLKTEKIGAGTVSEWQIEINDVQSTEVFTITEFKENQRLVFENKEKTLVIEHEISALKEKTLLQIKKVYYSDSYDKEGEKERLLTLLDNLRVVLSKKS